ncbi:MAG: hypothetical protein H7228_16435 [Polaromonas sp.]|nr:hypothetical protein [Polaromonas sp.]
MKKLIAFCLLVAGIAGGVGSSAQTPTAANSPSATLQATPDAERARINAQRIRLETGFSNEDAACYKKFLVNNCLDEVKVRRREALADLRRQEISLNAQDRKLKGAEQIRKTEEKSSPEKQQDSADRRAAALKDFQARVDRDKQKNAERETADVDAKSNIDSAASRAKGNQDKVTARSGKQAASAAEVKKFNERVEKAKERQARHDRDQLGQNKPVSKSLPVPE